MSDILVAKIGGSTLGAHDTTLEDVVALQRRGLSPVVVHGGGALISEWLKLHGVPTRFERGLRVTDERTLEVVVAVLAGVVNKGLVAALSAAGGRAVGLSGADGGLLKARLVDEKLGFVGEVAEVDTRPLLDLLDDGFVPVVATVAVEWRGDAPTGQLLNINADTAAGAVAQALAARWLVFLTDVPGIRDRDGKTVSALSAARANALSEAGVIQGGMIPKVEACLGAAGLGCRSVIADGRQAGALIEAIEERTGTVVG
jgi:acetylglutamate kinase